MRRAKADVALEIDGEQFSPGEEVKVRTTIAADEDINVREVVISLICVETFWRMESNGKTSSLRKKTQTLIEVPLQFATDSRFHRGIPYREEHRLTLPADSPLTLAGKIANISWQAKVSLDVAGARDIHVEKPVTVVSAQTISEDAASEYPQPVITEQSHDECRVRLELPSESWQIGDSMSGRLRLDAVEDCDFSEVRVELVLSEKAGDKKSQVAADSMVLEQDVSLSANRSQEWRFSLDLPTEPSRSTVISKTSLQWSVKGVLARKRRRDLSVEKEITVS